MPDLYQSPSQLVKSNNESKLSNSEYENMGDLIKWASPTYCKPKGSHRVSIVQILTFFKRPLKIMRKSVGKM